MKKEISMNIRCCFINDATYLKVGIDIPLIGYKHAYVTTDRIPGIENMPNIRDHDASVYLKLQGDCLHVGGYEVDPVLIEGVISVISIGKYYHCFI